MDTLTPPYRKCTLKPQIRRILGTGFVFAALGGLWFLASNFEGVSEPHRTFLKNACLLAAGAVFLGSCVVWSSRSDQRLVPVTAAGAVVLGFVIIVGIGSAIHPWLFFHGRGVASQGLRLGLTTLVLAVVAAAVAAIINACVKVLDRRSGRRR